MSRTLQEGLVSICSANVWRRSGGGKHRFSRGSCLTRGPDTSFWSVFLVEHTTPIPFFVLEGRGGTTKTTSQQLFTQQPHKNTPARARSAHEDRGKMAYGPRLARPIEATRSNPCPEPPLGPFVGRRRLAVSRHNLPRRLLRVPKASSYFRPWLKRITSGGVKGSARLRSRLRFDAGFSF